MIGLLVELFEARWHVSPTTRLALITGILGGYTTFSGFSFETYVLLREGELFRGMLNVSASVVLGLAAVWLGIRVAQFF